MVVVFRFMQCLDHQCLYICACLVSYVATGASVFPGVGWCLAHAHTLTPLHGFAVELAGYREMTV